MARRLSVVSVSLGSSRRDHRVEVEAGGCAFSLARVGTDGDLDRAEERIRALDGTVDAIGLGGIDIYLEAAGVRYEVRDGVRLRDSAHTTPVVDGSGVKATLERQAVEELAAEGVVGRGTPVLLVSALDRFGMAEAFAAAGCALRCGDLMFTAGIPYPIESLEELAELARKVLPQVSRLPFGMLYPTGEAQDRPPDARFADAYRRAEVIAGDFHFIRRHLPERLDGKTVVTNTTTAEDVADLARRGVRRLVTTTPDMGGRSFGTNVIEGMAVAYLGVRPEEIGPEDMRRALASLGVRPSSRLLEVNGA
jgi:hypothetical protein